MKINRRTVSKCGVLEIAIGLALVGSASVTEAAPAQMSGPFATPEYFSVPQYAYSPLPEVCTGVDTTAAGGHCTVLTPKGTTVGGLHKFVDGMPMLSASAKAGNECGKTLPNAVPTATAPYNSVNGSNNLGHCLTVATPDRSTYRLNNTLTDKSGKKLSIPAADYYSLEIVDYSRTMHSDLVGSPTPLHGYVQKPTAGIATPNQEAQYLSPVIIAAKGRPTRIKFKNSKLYEIPLPVDQTYFGAGSIDYNGPTNTAAAPMHMASTKRSNIHLHGGDTPWISDGTPHQWVVPAADSNATLGPGYSKGLSFQNVPDMVTGGWLLAGNYCAENTVLNQAECITEASGDGVGSLYYPNGQTSRLMFYHDHSFGITRLNVYMGEAAPYLLADPVQEESLRSMGVPGAIGVTTGINAINLVDGNAVGQTDLSHLIPLVIQDKTFVPDNGQPGGQLAAQDPTWPSPTNAHAATDFNALGRRKYWNKALGAQTDGWGKGNLWLPHVYVTNQLPIVVSSDLAGNPISPSSVAPIGRWDYMPWMAFPLNVNSNPVACSTTAYPQYGNKFSCPPMKNPTAVPESFMDTMVINGTVYPHLDIKPDAYRFKILNAGDDRFINMGMYIAVTQDPMANIVDSLGLGFGASAEATITGGKVTSYAVTSGGAGYQTSPIVTVKNQLNKQDAQAYVTVDSTGYVVKLVFDNSLPSGTGYNIGDTLSVVNDVKNTYGTWKVTAGNCQGAGSTNCAITAIAPLTAPAAGASQPVNPTVIKVNYGIEPLDYTTLKNSIPGFVEAKAIATVDNTGAVVDVMPDPTTPGTGYIAGGKSCENVPAAQVPLCTEVKQMYPAVPANPCTGSNSLLGGLDNMGLVHVPDLKFGRTGMPSSCFPDTWPQDGIAHSGLVPDPALAGPPIVQLGNEGGLLPSPLIIPSTPISYNYNRKMATVLGLVGGHGLDLAPAQRVDAVIDFHGFAPATAGNTTVLIAYNDHPAPAPLFDARYDMYTGDPDNSSSGGAPSTLPGYGPNTRTMLQIRVSGSSTNNPISVPNIMSTVTGVPALFASTQDKILVQEPQYPKNGLTKNGVTDPGNGYAPYPMAGANSTTSMPNVINGNTYNPLLDYKAIVEGFDAINGTLNVELGDSVPPPGVNTNGGALNYLTWIANPFGYTDPQSEVIADNQVVNWGIDHIGVDAHSLHFHLFNVQIVNYFDIAGQIYMPDSNQLGWNETVRTEPLTKVIVAMRPKNIPIPWDIPNSIRAMDTISPVGSTNYTLGPVNCILNPFAQQQFIGPNCVPYTSVDPTGNQVLITNNLINYGSEYVYHCHLLSHEEHDMMRPISFVTAPKNAPTLARSGANLVITDMSFNETDFLIEKSVNGGPWVPYGSPQPTPPAAQNPSSVQSGLYPVGPTPLGSIAGARSTASGTGTNGTITIPVPSVAGTLYRATAVNVVGCGQFPPATANGVVSNSATKCSNGFTAWPTMSGFSPASVAVQ